MSAFPKADVQNVRIGVEPNVCFWPIAAVQNARVRIELYVRLWPKADI